LPYFHRNSYKFIEIHRKQMYSPLQQAGRWVPALAERTAMVSSNPNSVVCKISNEPVTALVPILRDRSERFGNNPCGDVLIDRTLWNALVAKLPPGQLLRFYFGRMGTVLVDKALTTGITKTPVVVDRRPRMALASLIAGNRPHARVTICFVNGDRLDHRKENLVVTSTARRPRLAE
jgi:hypothetical protein